jgi:hypothetical protein
MKFSTIGFAMGAVAVAASLAFGAPASAQGWRGSSDIIGEGDRAVLRQFIVNQHARQCRQNETRGREPCGLASRVLRAFVPGSVLPSTLGEELVPAQVVGRLTVPPRGTAYVYADDNVYLIEVMTRRIIDAVPLGTD